MTHTLHRRGTAESLADDYVVIVMAARGKNDVGSAPKLSKALGIAQRHDPVNLGNMASGTLARVGSRGIFEQFNDGSIIHAVFRDRNDLDAYLKELKEADLGMSVTVSGLFAEVFRSLDKVGLTPHTVQYSLGTFGNLKRLPPDEVLNITTMCGHHLVSPALARKMVRDVKRRRISVEDAAHTLCKQCVCGTFNPARAERLLEDLTRKETRLF